MADKVLKDVETKQNVDFVLGTLTNGDTVKIKTADLAAAIGGIVKTYTGDLNEIRSTGAYRISNYPNAIENHAPSATGHGDILLCYVWNVDTTWQLLFHLTDKDLYFREGNATSWNNWKHVATK